MIGSSQLAIGRSRSAGNVSIKVLSFIQFGGIYKNLIIFNQITIHF